MLESCGRSQSVGYEILLLRHWYNYRKQKRFGLDASRRDWSIGSFNQGRPAMARPLMLTALLHRTRRVTDRLGPCGLPSIKLAYHRSRLVT